MGAKQKGARTLFGWFSKGGKSVDDIAALTAKLGDATKMLDDVGDLSKLDEAGEAGKYVTIKGGKVKPKDGYFIKLPDGSTTKAATKWEKGMKIVATQGKIDNITKAARGRNLIKADSVWQPNAMRNLKLGAMFGALGTMGYVFYRAIGIVGTFSDAAETAINNWYGIDCEYCEGDTACIEDCQEKGSRNMVLTGVAIIGVIGLLVMSKSGGKKEKSDESDD